MSEVIRDVPPTALAMGNLDRCRCSGRHPGEMRAETLSLLEKMADYPNFVLSSGCDTPPHTPMENIDAFFEALDEYNRK